MCLTVSNLTSRVEEDAVYYKNEEDAIYYKNAMVTVLVLKCSQKPHNKGMALFTIVVEPERGKT